VQGTNDRAEYYTVVRPWTSPVYSSLITS